MNKYDLVDPTSAEQIEVFAQCVDDGADHVVITLEAPDSPSEVAKIASLARTVSWKVVTIWHQSASRLNTDITHILLEWVPK